MKHDIKYLEKMANILRKDLLKMVYLGGEGHPGPALSIADIVAVLYFAEMNIDPENPQMPDRDRFILSKGHACPVLYAALARKGYFSTELYSSLRKINSTLQGHPDMIKTPGIDMTSGSLGHGISIGTGMAVSGRITNNDYNVYVIVGDGELNEGIVWESAAGAVKYNVGNLIVFVDKNNFQSSGETKEIGGDLPLEKKWKAFGWHCQKINGHNIKEILEAINNAQKKENCPSIIIADTIKGKGVSFIENNNTWHKRTPTKEEYNKALIELRGDSLD